MKRREIDLQPVIAAIPSRTVDVDRESDEQEKQREVAVQTPPMPFGPVS